MEAKRNPIRGMRGWIGFGLLLASVLFVAVGYVLIIVNLQAVPNEWERPLRKEDFRPGYHVGTALMVLGMITFLAGVSLHSSGVMRTRADSPGR